MTPRYWRDRHGRVKASERDIARALTGNWREEPLFVLGQPVAIFGSLAQRILECDAKIEALLAPRGRQSRGRTPAGRASGLARNEAMTDLRRILNRVRLSMPRPI